MNVPTGFTVRLTAGHVPGMQRITFYWGSTWIATFHASGATVGLAVTRRGHAEAEALLRARAEVILQSWRMFSKTVELLANSSF